MVVNPLIVPFSVETANIYAEGLYLDTNLAISPHWVNTIIALVSISKLTYTEAIAIDSADPIFFFFQFK